jgi:sugar lactone lactonase YvrE
MRVHRRLTIVLSLAAVLTATLVSAGSASSAAAGTSGAGGALPTTLQLPDGFQPEGIAIGRSRHGAFAYFGSRADGRIFRVDLVTGAGRQLSPPVGTASLGMKTDGRLFVAGGGGGDARVIDVRTGAVLASYRFVTSGETFVNDVVLTGGAAYFTDSRRAVLYKLTLGRHGELPATFATLPLTGDLVITPGATNLTGIAATPDGRALVVVQSNTGLLFRVDPATGATTLVDTGGRTFPGGDGLWASGRTLYLVQNRLNTVVALELSRTGATARWRAERIDPRFDVPTTIAQFGHRLYLPNARFTTPPTPTTPYNAVAIAAF